MSLEVKQVRVIFTAASSYSIVKGNPRSTTSIQSWLGKWNAVKFFIFHCFHRQSSEKDTSALGPHWWFQDELRRKCCIATFTFCILGITGELSGTTIASESSNTGRLTRRKFPIFNLRCHDPSFRASIIKNTPIFLPSIPNSQTPSLSYFFPQRPQLPQKRLELELKQVNKKESVIWGHQF